MSIRRIAGLRAGYLLVAVLSVGMSAHASTKSAMRITVLDSVTRASNPQDNGVPTNCDQLTFDAYCRSTTYVPLVNTLLVQEGDEPPFRISCTAESRFSRCTPLPMGATFDAKRNKHGITVYYVDDKGKARSQLYTLLDTGAKTGPQLAAATGVTQPVPAVTAQRQNSPAPAAALAAPSNPQNSPAPAPAPAVLAEKVAEKVKVKCNFGSTPPGAEILSLIHISSPRDTR